VVQSNATILQRLLLRYEYLFTIAPQAIMVCVSGGLHVLLFCLSAVSVVPVSYVLEEIIYSIWDRSCGNGGQICCHVIIWLFVGRTPWMRLRSQTAWSVRCSILFRNSFHFVCTGGSLCARHRKQQFGAATEWVGHICGAFFVNPFSKKWVKSNRDNSNCHRAYRRLNCSAILVFRKVLGRWSVTIVTPPFAPSR
jgi:hypothetical protein